MKYILTAALVSYLCPVAAGSIRYRHLEKPQRIFFWYTCSSILFLLVEYQFSHMRINNHAVINMNIVVETACLLAFFSSLSYPSSRKWIGATALLFMGYSVLMLTRTNIFMMNEHISIVSRLLILSFSLMMLHSIFQKSKSIIVARYPYWVLSGIVIYSCGSLLIFVFSNKILQLEYQYFELMWSINWIAAIAANILFSISFFIRRV